MAWVDEAGASDAASVVEYLEKRFLRIELSADKKAEVANFLETRDWAPVPEDDPRRGEMEYLLRRGLHLILCTPEYQLH
jgi:hypothetical protein